MTEIIDHKAELSFIKSPVWDFVEWMDNHYPDILEEYQHEVVRSVQTVLQR